MTVPALNVFIQGQGVASADNLNTFIQGGAVASQLRTITGLPGMTVMLAGIAVVNDGNGGFFYWNPLGTHLDDNYNYITPYGTFIGQWVRILLPTATGAGTFTTLTATQIANLESDVVIGGILSESSATGLTATGTNQATALLLATNINVVTIVAAGTGVLLPVHNLSGNALPIGTSIKVLNRGANNLLCYPPSSAAIETLAANAPVTIVSGGNNTFTFVGSAKWYIS